MSRDIRSYFTVVSKKSNSDIKSKSNTTASNTDAKKRKNRILDDSDDDDVIAATPESKTTTKRKAISSDSEDENKSKNTKKSANTTSKLKPVNVEDVFKKTPIKQSKVVVEKSEKINNNTNGIEKEKPKKSKKNKNTPEIQVHKDTDFARTLLELDDDNDDILASNIDVLDKTIEEEIINKDENQSPSTSRKRSRDDSINSDNNSPKKKKNDKFEHTDSGIDPGQEAYEKRRYSAMLYQKYLNRSGPKHHGMKEIPKGKPDCLNNLCFLRTGVLDSLESEEFDNLIKSHGGRVVHAVSKKVNYVVVGEDPGPSKLDKARGYKIPEITEDELLDLILVKSGMEAKYCRKIEKKPSEDQGICDEILEIENTEDNLQKFEKINEVKTKKSPIKVETKSKKGREKSPIKTKDNIKTKEVSVKIEENKAKLKKLPVKETNHETIKKTDSIDDTLNLALTDKYKPKDLKSIIGQQGDNSNMNKLKHWLENWYQNQKPEMKKTLKRPSPWAKNDNGEYFKCALLSGPPGVGKTTTSTLVAKSLNFDIVEFNASDTRSKRLLHEEVSQLLSTNTIAGFATGQHQVNKKRVLLMDEVDGMAGNEDRGGIQELIQLIKTTQVPIICMCNDRNHPKTRSLVNYCYDLRFNPPKLEQIRGAMLTVCFKEGIKISPNALTQIIAGTNCDIRQTLNHLSLWSTTNKCISIEEAEKGAKNAKKDTILGPWEVCRKVFTNSEHKDLSVADKARLFFYDYSLGPLFVQENYLKVQPQGDPKKLLRKVAAAADSISMGDTIDSTIRSTNNWSLLETQAMFSSVFPGHFMSGHFVGRIDFPSWLGKNSKRSKFNRIASEIQTHIRMTTSASILAVKLDYLLPLRNSIISPLKKDGLSGIDKAVNVMKSYNLLREDLDGLVELSQWCSSNTNPLSDIDSKVKSAFTRNYNKHIPLLPYAPTTGLSKAKFKHQDNDLLGETDELIESENEPEDDDIGKDALIKVKEKKAAKPNNDRPGTSKKKETKGSSGRGRKKK